MNIEKIYKSLFCAALISASALTAQTAYADFTLHYKNDIPVPSEALPTSYSDAVNEDFYFIFDSFYQDKESGGWVGDFISLSATVFGLPVSADCRTQLGGYVWQDGEDPKTVRIAVTHSLIGKPTPDGFPDNDSTCDNINALHNNGQPAHPGFAAAANGAWGSEGSAADVNSGSFLTNFENVQVVALGSNCSSASGNAGQVTATYDDNGAGNRISFSFNDTITPASSLNCNVDGEFYSVIDKQPIDDPDYTPTSTNPSPLSRGIVDFISNP
jgi:hypothetical protein